MLCAWDILILFEAFSIFMLVFVLYWCHNVKMSSEETGEARICIATSEPTGYLEVAQSTITVKGRKQQFGDLL
jgi:hypothetical protein